MAYRYDDAVHVDPNRDVAFSWLRDERGVGSRVRVEVSREHMEDYWRVEWRDQRVVCDEFAKRRGEYIDRASRLPEDGTDFRIYQIWKVH